MDYLAQEKPEPVKSILIKHYGLSSEEMSIYPSRTLFKWESAWRMYNSFLVSWKWRSRMTKRFRSSRTLLCFKWSKPSPRQSIVLRWWCGICSYSRRKKWISAVESTPSKRRLPSWQPYLLDWWLPIDKRVIEGDCIWNENSSLLRGMSGCMGATNSFCIIVTCLLFLCCEEWMCVS